MTSAWRRQHPDTLRGTTVLEVASVGTGILVDAYIYTMTVALMATERRVSGMERLRYYDWKEDLRQSYASGLGLAYGVAMIVPAVVACFFSTPKTFQILAMDWMRVWGVTTLLLASSYPVLVVASVLNGLAAGLALVRGVWAIADWKGDALGHIMSFWTVALCCLVHLPAVLIFEWHEPLDQKLEPRYRVWLAGLFLVVVSLLLNVVCMIVGMAEKASAREQALWPCSWTAAMTRRASHAALEATASMEAKKGISPSPEPRNRASRWSESRLRLATDLVGLGTAGMVITALIPLLYKFMWSQKAYWSQSLCENLTVTFFVSVVFACGSAYLVGARNLPGISAPLGMTIAVVFLVVLDMSPWECPKVFRHMVLPDGRFKRLPGDPLPVLQWAGHVALVACASLVLPAFFKDAFDAVAQAAEEKEGAEAEREFSRKAILGIPLAIGIGCVLGNIPSIVVWGGGMQQAAGASAQAAINTIMPLLYFVSSLPISPSIFYLLPLGSMAARRYRRAAV